ncbi:uncharacterized protein LOC132021129 [Mustela nigripes]|uniref:uncharacterized protein LOC132021129 n=1 Tax=Mustela nigripes TaxID=77151 RepID=UPI00281598B2|nr:uncharacterized protein LOC132021129 [Mustela nigripes]XP_059261123.1 uncharacterized protein LOC132021129 [Mustela nigripes]XP_059261124.1 uncharacterized protein LOC132021129 [Mustela nigripes]
MWGPSQDPEIMTRAEGRGLTEHKPHHGVTVISLDTCLSQHLACGILFLLYHLACWLVCPLSSVRHAGEKQPIRRTGSRRSRTALSFVEGCKRTLGTDPPHLEGTVSHPSRVGKPGLGAFSQERPSHQENVSSSSLWKSLNKEAGGSMGTVDVTGSSQNPGDKRKDSKYKFTKLKVPSLWLSPGNKGIRSWRDFPGRTAGHKPIMILHHSPPPPWRTPTTRSHVASRITPQGPRKAGSPPDCHRRRRKRGRSPGASKVSGVRPVLVLKTVGWAAGVAQRVEAFAFGSGHDLWVLGWSPASGSLLGGKTASLPLSACLSVYL